MPPFRIELSEATFRRDVADAKKRHSTITEDLKEAFEQLENNHTLGVWIPGLKAQVRKLRLGVKRHNIGKSCGYRLIYLVDEGAGKIIPLLLHYKPKLELVSNEEIMEVIKGITAREAPTQPLSVRPDLLN